MSLFCSTFVIWGHNEWKVSSAHSSLSSYHSNQEIHSVRSCAHSLRLSTEGRDLVQQSSEKKNKTLHDSSTMATIQVNSTCEQFDSCMMVEWFVSTINKMLRNCGVVSKNSFRNVYIMTATDFLAETSTAKAFDYPVILSWYVTLLSCHDVTLSSYPISYPIILSWCCRILTCYPIDHPNMIWNNPFVTNLLAEWQQERVKVHGCTCVWDCICNICIWTVIWGFQGTHSFHVTAVTSRKWWENSHLSRH